VRSKIIPPGIDLFYNHITADTLSVKLSKHSLLVKHSKQNMILA